MNKLREAPTRAATEQQRPTWLGWLFVALSLTALAKFSLGRHRPVDLCAAASFALVAALMFRSKRPDGRNIQLALAIATIVLGACWLVLTLALIQT